MILSIHRIAKGAELLLLEGRSLSCDLVVHIVDVA